MKLLLCGVLLLPRGHCVMTTSQSKVLIDRPGGLIVGLKILPNRPPGQAISSYIIRYHKLIRLIKYNLYVEYYLLFCRRYLVTLTM